MDVNGWGDFSPPWNQEQMFGPWTSHRQSDRELILLTTHQTPGPRYFSCCQVPKDGNYQRIHLKTGKTISQTWRQPVTSLLFLLQFLWDWRLVLPTVWHSQYTVNTVKMDTWWALKWRMLEAEICFSVPVFQYLCLISSNKVNGIWNVISCAKNSNINIHLLCCLLLRFEAVLSHRFHPHNSMWAQINNMLNCLWEKTVNPRTSA